MIGITPDNGLFDRGLVSSVTAIALLLHLKVKSAGMALWVCRLDAKASQPCCILCRANDASAAWRKMDGFRSDGAQDDCHIASTTEHVAIGRLLLGAVPASHLVFLRVKDWHRHMQAARGR
jgi:hypothetical protein